MLITILIALVALRCCYLTYQSHRQAQSTELRCDTGDDFFAWLEDHQQQCTPCSAQGSLLLRRFINAYHDFNRLHGWQADKELEDLLNRTLKTHTCKPKQKRHKR